MGSSASNREVGRAVQEVEGVTRGMFLVLSERLRWAVSARERSGIRGLLVESVAKGADGKVAYERITGKRPRVMGVEICEKQFFSAENCPWNGLRVW